MDQSDYKETRKMNENQARLFVHSPCKVKYNEKITKHEATFQKHKFQYISDNSII